MHEAGMIAPEKMQTITITQQPHEMTQTALESVWLKFGAALAGAILRDEHGNPVRRTVGDFMLMNTTDDGGFAFKSRETRNYVFLSASGRLSIPRTNRAFMRGHF